MKFLVCGGSGFIGSAFIRNNLENTSNKIINLDNLSIGSKKNLTSYEKNKNYTFINGDIKNKTSIDKLVKDVEIVVNFAAETHVDRSIANPKSFVETNFLGTYSLLESIRKYDKMFVHISTDEVYGDNSKKSFKENANLIPGNPYSATKASADLLVGSYVRTYGTNCIITRCSNNFGPHQHPEKLIPKTIIRLLKNLKVPLYGDGNQIRSWIYVSDHVDAINSLIMKQKKGVYNIGAYNEISNKSVVEKIIQVLGKSQNQIEYVDDRPGHDKRYSIDSTKIQKTTGWKPKHNFDDALKETINWYVHNKSWWEPMANKITLHSQPWTIR
jgi:dTDP-glucose 4,6-dehydratase